MDVEGELVSGEVAWRVQGAGLRGEMGNGGLRQRSEILLPENWSIVRLGFPPFVIGERG